MRLLPLLIPIRVFIALAMLIHCAAGTAQAWTPNAQEQDIANRMANASGQRRAFLQFDPILAQVARERATDLAKRAYFDHINPDGHGVNFLVRKAGYLLPAGYPADGNNLESIAAGGSNAATTWGDWMGSPDHKRHLLAELDFFAAQTSYGIGFYEDPHAPYRYYWVVITAPPMASPATLTIDAPGEGAPVPEGAVAASGTTGGGQSAAAVQISLENANGATGWQIVAGTQSWSVSLTNLAPGANTLHARSLSAAGAVLAETARNFRYVVLRPLTVRVEGQGSVGEFAGTTSRELGSAYTITATPSADWLFAGWSGGWGGAQTTATFTMSAGLEALATFVPNPFTARSGAYSGAIGDAAAEHAARGLLRLRLDGLGQFSGRLFLGGKAYAVLGSFGVDGKAAVRFPRDGARALKLKLDLNADGGRIGGWVKDGAATSSFAVVRDAGGALAALAGSYTLAIPANRASTDPAIPQGDGLVTMFVDANGRATLTGALADGTAISNVGWIAADGRLALYAPLFNGQGSLSGTLVFSDAPASDLAGSLRWIAPPRADATRFPQGFNTVLESIGARYTPPAPGQPVLVLTGANPNAQFIFGGGNIGGEIVQRANLELDNSVSIGAPALPALSVKIKAATGVFKGAFKHPATSAAAKFRGVLLQKQNAGAGFFPGVDQSGYVRFAPGP